MYFKLVVLSLVVIDSVLATGSSYRCMMVANTAGLLMGIYGCHESGCTVPKKPSFGDRFDQYDANGDGQLSYAEMSSVANDMVPGKILLYMHIIQKAHSGESLFFQTCGSIVIVFWLKWAGYLAVAGLNLVPLLSDKVSPFGV